jgi:glycosyltransferase involved in cell wall biosynthesis
MKIVQVIPYFYPAWAYGGTPRVVFDLCREMVKQGQNVTVYTTDTLDKNTRVDSKIQNPKSAFPLLLFHFNAEIDGIKVRYLRNLSNHLAFSQKLFLTPSFPFLLRDGLKDTDIVHFQEYRTLQNVSAWKACRKKRVPYVVSAHGAILKIMGREKRKGLFDLWFGYKILQDARKLIAVTELEKNQYEEFGIEEEKVVVVPNGIDLTQFSSLPEKGLFHRRHSLEGFQIILYLGRIHRIKGIDIMIDAFAELKKENKKARLIIAGPDDGFKESCEFRVSSFGLKQIDLSRGGKIEKEDVKKADVIFTGMVNGEEKLSLLRDADVTVLPSRFENFPSVPFESLMCGTPVVVSEICGVARMIQEAGAGYITRTNDGKNLAEKIREVLDHPQEAAISVKRGKELIEEKLNWNRIARNILQVYRDCLN